jgi:diguanylate cyclase (GGDEF)-like protein
MKQAHSGNYEKADLHLRTAEAIAEGEDRMYSRIALLRQRAALAEEAGKTGRALALEREAGDLARAFYNLETDERELARLLNSFDSNILEVELALREAEAARLRSFILAAILGAVLAVGAAAFAWQRYRSHARANQRLQVEADHDGLTSLMNRRKMEVLLDSYEQATRAGALDPAVVIALIDLDNFKMVNDRYGHDGGDQVLREVAKVLLKASRPQDPVCRWGGEEFVLVFEAMSLAEGLRWANHLRSAVARADLTLECGRTVAVTFSAGLAVLHKGLSAKDTLRMADQALYAAKAAGRNRVLAAKEVRYHHGEAGFDHDRSPALAMDQGQANVGTVSIEGMGALHLYTEREEEARRSVSAAG